VSAAASTEACADLLRALVARRTVNPGGDEVALCEDLALRLTALGADAVELVEDPRPEGRGAYVFARFGTPRLLLNAHVDTVPVNRGWTGDPFALTRDGDRLIGLGACDTKGAIAAILTAIDPAHGGRPARDTGILFSGDEELGARSLAGFLKTPSARGIERAIVCEPTARRIGVAHRGVLAYRADLASTTGGGHSSLADRLDNPLVGLARLAVSAAALGQARKDQGPPGMPGLCLNVAGLDGGVAFNVVPERGSLGLSLRPPPGFDRAALDGELAALAAAAHPGIAIAATLDHHPFACREPAAFRPLLGAALERATALDFWTEAAVLSEAGIDAVVVGPGDIAQAHAAGEYVTLDDLAWAVDLFRGVVAATGA
jgi:acetylornithine deacetylase